MKQTSKQFYNSIRSLTLLDTCVSCNINQWNEYMSETKKASYKEIHSLINRLCPEYKDLTLMNPYKYQYKRKEGLIVLVHSAIEYFFKIN